jgi:regulator of replication initiation timing
MAMHNTNGLLKYVLIPVVILGAVILLLNFHHKKGSEETETQKLTEKKIEHGASNDSAAESLDTLTAELSTTKQQVEQITRDNTTLKHQNETLLKKLQNPQDTSSLKAELEQLKDQIGNHSSNNYPINPDNSSQPITIIPDVANSFESKSNHSFPWLKDNKNPFPIIPQNSSSKPKSIPYYTIPANATAVKDRLMSALVGRIPIKGVVTDPYPFKIVFSDDTLAANGLRVPHLKQMIVSGYTEGDLNLLSVRGWVTSLTFVFEDGTISTTTSNNNDIGHFTKENALGYLSDKWGNPFIRGKLITNAPAFLAGNIALSAAQGAANAYAQSQTTNQNSIFGTVTSSVTGSPGAYMAGQAASSAASQAQQWWHDREEQSFDAIYVPTVNTQGETTEISVNFAKEIDIDYNVQGRKIAYAHNNNFHISRHLD